MNTAIAITSGLFFAAYGLSVRRFLHGVNPLVAFAAISQYTAGAMMLLMLAFGRGGGVEPVDLSAFRFSMLLLSSVIGIGLGHTFYYIAIARLGVAVSAGVIQIQPIIVAVASLALARLEPAVPTVTRGSVILDKVSRGSFTREVPGLGTLVPEDTRWLPATTNGRVERNTL